MIRLETKYRLWQGDHQRMLYNIYVEREGNLVYVFNSDTKQQVVGVWMIETMTHDKNGKLIYEGDIVKGPNELRTYVQHKDIFAQWLVDNNLTESDILVVGNKFETPDKLLPEDSQE